MADSASGNNRSPGQLRASDADRDRVAHTLSDALIEGRLTQEEHADRIDATYAAKTMDELATLTDDLPWPGSNPAIRGGRTASVCPSDRALLDTSTGSESIVAVLGAAERHGRWLVEPRTNASAACGSIELDLREAVLARRSVTVQCALLCSGLRLVVPPGLRVSASSGLGCSVNVDGYTAPDNPDAPTVHLTGVSMMSGIEVRTQESPGHGRSPIPGNHGSMSSV